MRARKEHSWEKHVLKSFAIGFLRAKVTKQWDVAVNKDFKGEVFDKCQARHGPADRTAVYSRPRKGG